jgi:leader peptidase (prepilin peptidase)/N-methyltransferase
MVSSIFENLRWFYATFAFLLGAIFGSFLNVCIYRLPRGMSVVAPRSACPHCHKLIVWHDNIPILSWLLLRGRCRNCKGPITPRYAIVEACIGLLFMFCYLNFTGYPTVVVRGCFFCFLIVGLIFTDAETFLLPDALTLPGTVAGVALAAIAPLNSYLELTFYHQSVLEGGLYSWRLLSVGDALIGAAFGGGAIWLIGYIYKKIRHIDGMGFGDVKMMALVGAFLGYEGTLVVLLLGSVAGSGFGLLMVAARFRRRLRELRKHGGKRIPRRAWHSAKAALRYQQLPFGVFLGGAALPCLFFYSRIVDFYLRLAGMGQ